MRLTLSLFLLTACSRSAPPAAPAPTIAATPMDTARTDADVALDAGRHPTEIIAYYTVTPGMRVADMMAGGGYSTEVLARSVGESGQVYGVNSPFILDRFAEAPWSARLQRPVNGNVVRLDREFDSPFPEDVRDLDRVFSILVYHDFVWMETDRKAMNKAVFDALKPGGIYAVIDHSAEDGSELRDVKTLHRIDEAAVRREIEAAGFTFVGDSNAWRNPEDPRDWSASPQTAGERRGTSDRFALTFAKPGG